MKNIFNLDSPLYQIMEKVADLMILNFLFLIFSIPIFTIGASITALNRVTQDFAAKKCDGVVRTFLDSFKKNLSQATIIWLILLAIVGILVFNLVSVYFRFVATVAWISYLLIGISLLIVLAVASIIFPLLARYENSLKKHFVNAAVIALSKICYTIFFVVVSLAPVIIFLYSAEAFIATLIIWVLIGFSGLSLINSYQINRIFYDIENKRGER